ncbi:hypothetical protein SAMN05421639_104311 [Chryseobacterium shigense]|uniref:Uncharacterized protein n=1 Tax=Chryseobacterium shigense TaxID=297244 RepID=A0A1N7IP22_9FLAO|nr:hypothetical protein SAMN05421639_104311 [Chryseobacterium shigense]
MKAKSIKISILKIMVMPQKKVSGKTEYFL